MFIQLFGTREFVWIHVRVEIETLQIRKHACFSDRNIIYTLHFQLNTHIILGSN